MGAGVKAIGTMAAAAILILFTALPAQAATGLFGSQETRADNLAAFSKWTDMLARHVWEESRSAIRQPCRLDARARNSLKPSTISSISPPM